MKKRLLLIISAFFIFTGCGIPTIFNVTTSISIHTTDIDEVKATIAVTNTERLDWITPYTGPSLMLAYVITDSPTLPSNNAISQFSTLFVRQPNGRNFITKDVYENGLFPNSDDPITKSIFPFSDGTNEEFKAPLYVATAKDRTNSNDTSSIKLDNDELLLSFDENRYKVLASSDKLLRYNGEPFKLADGITGNDI